MLYLLIMLYEMIIENAVKMLSINLGIMEIKAIQKIVRRHFQSL